jgi:hypothetical protein
MIKQPSNRIVVFLAALILLVFCIVLVQTDLSIFNINPSDTGVNLEDITNRLLGIK